MSELTRPTVRWLLAVLAGVLVALAAAPTAHADPAGPTDYRSEVVEIEPPTPSINATVIGGDSFFELTVDPGTEVIVIGYQPDEQYLWFRADGTVFENRNAPSTYLSDDRFGTGEIPDHADADAEPAWREVASDGTWVWHDHRAHWMQESRPVGFSPGDQILAEAIPLRVDGADVEVRVTSTWQPDPSPVPAWLGAIAGALTVGAAWVLRRTGRPAVAAALPAVVLATVIGAWQYWSLPAATGPRIVWVVLPTIAVVCALAGAVMGRRSPFAADAAALIVGVELTVWGWIKRDGLGAAIIPTDAPMWLDRSTTALALAGGVGLTVSALWWLFAASSAATPGVSGSREPTGSPRPAQP